MAKSYKSIADKYAKDVSSGKKIAGKEMVMACERFLNDIKRDDIELRTKAPDVVINIIEDFIVHKQGQDINGKPLVGEPLKLQPWQVFIVYNLVGFYYKGTEERRYKEAFIFLPRKSGKTLFVSGLAWGLAVLEMRSGSKIYITSASLKQAMQSFENLKYMLIHKKMVDVFTVHDNNMDHSMLTAMAAVRCITTGTTDKASVWDVNTEQEYHESK